MDILRRRKRAERLRPAQPQRGPDYMGPELRQALDWESFLGRTPREAVTDVGVSAVTGDYTLTLREAIVDDSGAAFLLALTRNDGGVLEGDPRLNGNLFGWDVKVDGERPTMSSSSWLPILSEDGRALYYCVEFEDEEQEPTRLLGKTVTFTCNGVADMAWTEEEVQAVRRETVSLALLAGAVRQLDMSYGDICKGVNGPEVLALVEELSARASVPLTKWGEDKAQISALRLQLAFDQGQRASWDWDHREDTSAWALLYTDGSRVPLGPPAIKDEEQDGTGWISLEGRDENGNRLLIDPDQAEALLVGEVSIPLT